MILYGILVIVRCGRANLSYLLYLSGISEHSYIASGAHQMAHQSRASRTYLLEDLPPVVASSPELRRFVVPTPACACSCSMLLFSLFGWIVFACFRVCVFLFFYFVRGTGGARWKRLRGGTRIIPGLSPASCSLADPAHTRSLRSTTYRPTCG